MITNWIDDITKLIGGVSGQGKMKVKTYTIAEIPESIQEVPSALSYITNVKALYSMGGSCRNIYSGQTDVHLTLDTSKKNLGWAYKVHDLIIAAVAARMTLNNKVVNFEIDNDSGGIEGPVVGTYGSEAPHFVIIVHWTVVENVTGQFTVGQ